MQLSQLHDRLWRMLENAIDDPAHGFHSGVLANGANARTVVLRGARREPPPGSADVLVGNRLGSPVRRGEPAYPGAIADEDVGAPRAARSGQHPHVLIYSDRRALKIEQLRADPRATLVLHAERCQLRLRGTVGIHLDDALADAEWARCPMSSRRAYLASVAPGSVLATPGSALPEGLDTRAPTLEESLPGRVNFAVLRLAVDEIDCLLLEPGGHRRAGFRADGVAEWRVP